MSQKFGQILMLISPKLQIMIENLKHSCNENSREKIKLIKSYCSIILSDFGTLKDTQHVTFTIWQHGFMFHIYADGMQSITLLTQKLPGEAGWVILKFWSLTFLLRSATEYERKKTKKNKKKKTLKLNDSKTELFIASPLLTIPPNVLEVLLTSEAMKHHHQLQVGI